MDSKRLKFDEKDTLKDIEAFSSFPLVGDTPSKVYLYVKAQRLSIALHLITNHIKDIEPAKFEVRKNAISLVENVSKLNRTSEKDRQEVIGSIGEMAFAIISIVETLMHVGVVSVDNGSIIKRELVFLVKLADGHVTSTENKGSLDQEVFNVPAVQERFETKKVHGELQKKQSRKTPLLENQESVSLGVNEENGQGRNQVFGGKKTEDFSIGHIGQSISDNRISSIVSLLKVRSGLSVKDFMEVIPGVSEKTIQRELAVLADKGVVIRAGERRWTRYSLAS